MNKYLASLSEENNPMYDMTSGMSIDTLATMADGMLTKELIYVLNKELIKVKKA